MVKVTKQKLHLAVKKEVTETTQKITEMIKAINKAREEKIVIMIAHSQFVVV